MKVFLAKAVFAAMVMTILLCFFALGCSKTDSKSTLADTPIGRVSIGINGTIKCSAIIIGEELGIFEKNALEVSIVKYSSGNEAMKSLFSGKINLATVPEHIPAFDSFNRSDFQIASVINRNRTNVLIADKSRGILGISDLKGKTIGLKKRSSSIYWLSRLLLYNDLSIEEVNLKDASPQALVEMLSQGKVDAILTWYPYVRDAEVELKDRTYRVAAQLGEDMYWVIAGMSDWLNKNHALMVRLLQAIQEANDFINAHPSGAKHIVAKYLGIQTPYIDSEWPLHRFDLELPQHLIIAMEQVARWKLSQMSDEHSLPNYLNYIYFDALEEARPNAVSIIH
jgi:NitT/TauT family transport system substrate-binding protein